MRVDIADAGTGQGVTINQLQYFLFSRDTRLGQVCQHLQDRLARFEMAECDLTDDERMRRYAAVTEERRKPLVGQAQMIDLHRRIDKDHVALIRRRGGATRSGCVPPRRANRRALSR